jgi:hypothetical protein
MQIDHVQYERRMSDGQYGNRMMSASATLVEGDNPAEALDTLRGLVVGKLAADVEAERAEEEAERNRLRAAQEERQARSRAQRADNGGDKMKDVDLYAWEA